MRYNFILLLSLIVIFADINAMRFLYHWIDDPMSSFIGDSVLTFKCSIVILASSVFVYPALCVAIISLGKIKDRIKSKQA